MICYVVGPDDLREQLFVRSMSVYIFWAAYIHSLSMARKV